MAVLQNWARTKNLKGSSTAVTAVPHVLMNEFGVSLIRLSEIWLQNVVVVEREGPSRS